VDDDDLFRKSIGRELAKMGYDVHRAEDSRQALSEIRSFPPDVILLDVRLPDQDGLQLLRVIKSRDPSIEIVMLTAYGSIDTAVNSLQMGAYHYLVKPAKLTEIDALIKKAYEKRNLAMENRALKEKLEFGYRDDVIIGSSPKIERLLELVERVAPTDQTVLLYGDSGTGKELIARRIHRLSLRRNQPFVLVDCSSLNRSLLESELYGHEKGAFTGAVAVKHGLIETADTGTLFVDEVGSLEPEMQSGFLRVMETHEYRRVGGTRTRKADIRVIAATNTDLSQAASENRFREDLFFRLSVIVLVVPPLRERREDIPSLAEHFLQATQIGGRPKQLSPEALRELQKYDWPGNVRELRNVIERASLLSDGDTIEIWDLRMFYSPSHRVVKQLLPDDELVPMRDVHSRYIRLVLERVKGNQIQAAKILGIDPKTIYRSLRKKT
jgi:DNA-binding NtrC family response regulator